MDEEYDKLFDIHKERFGLSNAKYKFKYLQEFEGGGRCPEKGDTIFVDAKNGFPSMRSFRGIVRHELWHLKFRKTKLDREFLAILVQFLPIEKLIK